MDDLGLDELGDRICELSAHIAAAQYRWLRMLSSFDRRGGWKQWGVRSCAHWLNWRCGLDLRSAREKVRVARALDDLEAVCEAFSRGELSYSKVRAITRIATPGNEADLLALAKHGTTQHVEKIVRGYRRCLPDEEVDRRHDRRFVDWRYDEDGSVVIQARLDPEEGELVIEALRKVQEEVRATRRTAEEREDGSAEPRRDRADALTEIARRELSGSAQRSSAGDRYTVVVQVDASVVGGGDGSCRLDSGPALGVETVRRLLCDGSVVPMNVSGDGDVLSVGRKTRVIPRSIRRALQRRDGGCRFPGCTNRAYLDGHHITPWAHGGETSLPNLVLLCSFHHRLMHEGGVVMRVERDGKFTFTRADGRVIETAALSVDPGGVEAANRELGLEIDSSTPVPRWWGDTCDYGVAIEGLLRRRSRSGAADERNGSGSAEPFPDDPVDIGTLCESAKY